MSDEFFEENSHKDVSEESFDVEAQESEVDSKPNSESILYMSESKILKRKNPLAPSTKHKFKSPIFGGNLLVMKEQVKKNMKVYHICDGSDISQFKQIEEEERERISLLQSINSEVSSSEENKGVDAEAQDQMNADSKH